MLKYAYAGNRCLCAAFAVALPLCLSGCDAQQSSGVVKDETPVVATPTSPAPETTFAKLATSQKPKPKPGAKTKVLARAGDQQYDKTFDDLRFEMTVGDKFKRSMLTKDIEALSGQKIRIRGYILPTPQKHGIHQFVLVRDNQECCFGPGAALYDCILVEMKKDATADFTIYPIAVEGTFNVREFVIEGKHMAIYQMDGELAQPR